MQPVEFVEGLKAEFRDSAVAELSRILTAAAYDRLRRELNNRGVSKATRYGLRPTQAAQMSE